MSLHPPPHPIARTTEALSCGTPGRTPPGCPRRSRTRSCCPGSRRTGGLLEETQVSRGPSIGVSRSCPTQVALPCPCKSSSSKVHCPSAGLRRNSFPRYVCPVRTNPNETKDTGLNSSPTRTVVVGLGAGVPHICTPQPHGQQVRTGIPQFLGCAGGVAAVRAGTAQTQEHGAEGSGCLHSGMSLMSMMFDWPRAPSSRAFS